MKTRPMYIHRGRRCQPRRAQVAVAAANTAIDARWLLVLLAVLVALGWWLQRQLREQGSEQTRALETRLDQITRSNEQLRRDLDSLRSEVERSLRKTTQLIEEINRKWPFARDTEIKLP